MIMENLQMLLVLMAIKLLLNQSIGRLNIILIQKENQLMIYINIFFL